MGRPPAGMGRRQAGDRVRGAEKGGKTAPKAVGKARLTGHTSRSGGRQQSAHSDEKNDDVLQDQSQEALHPQAREAAACCEKKARSVPSASQIRDPAAVGLMGPPGPEAADNRKVSAAGVDLRDERPVDVLRSCRSGIPAQPLHCPERPQGWRYGRCHSAGDVSWSLCGLT